MTGGIGNPDWQRRYVTSAVPILTATIADDTNRVTGIADSNGYEYLVVSTHDPGATTFKHIKVDWFQDQNATLQMGDTDWTIPPNSFNVVKVPVITRFYKIEIGPVGGASGNNTTLVVYGTNADQENLLTQNTAIPFIHAEPTIAAGATDTETATGIFGGNAMLMISDNGNNLWNASVQYYDWTTSAWATFWKGFGSFFGQTATQNIILPYAPIRVQTTNTDSAAHGFFIAVVTP